MAKNISLVRSSQHIIYDTVPNHITVYWVAFVSRISQNKIFANSLQTAPHGNEDVIFIFVTEQKT